MSTDYIINKPRKEQASMKKPYHIVNSKEFLDDLLNYVIDHIKHFRAYPYEFWFNDRVYKFKTYMKVLKTRKERRV